MFGELTHREILAFGLGGLVSLAAFNLGVAQARMIPSGSMAPTFVEGDRVLVVPRVGTIERGDIVVFKPPFKDQAGGAFAALADQTPYVKRCVALAGDTVEVKPERGLFINGQAVSEPYILEKPHYHWGPVKVPAGDLVTLGDNRNNSFDSHLWGFLPADHVTGRPRAVIWPFRHWRGL